MTHAHRTTPVTVKVFFSIRLSALFSLLKRTGSGLTAKDCAAVTAAVCAIALYGEYNANKFRDQAGEVNAIIARLEREFFYQNPKACKICLDTGSIVTTAESAISCPECKGEGVKGR